MRATPTFDSAYFELGELNSFVFKDYEAALENFNTLLEHNPSFNEAHLGKGYCYLKLDMPQEARRSLTTYLGTNPQEGMAYYLRALAIIEMDWIWQLPVKI